MVFLFPLIAVAADGIWDIMNPELICVPTENPNITHPVRCMTLVKNRLWLGMGPFLAFLEVDSLIREVMIVLVLVSV